MGASQTDESYLTDICPYNICTGDICSLYIADIPAATDSIFTNFFRLCEGYEKVINGV